jgi:FAD:protein FMN transferase
VLTQTHSPGTAAISSGRPAIAEVAGRSFPVFGTYGAVLVTSPGALAAACNLLAVETAAIDAACSRFRADSEISLVNRAGGGVVEVSDLFARALRTALTGAAVTDGDVDPTCGGSLVSIGYDRDFAQVRADTAALSTAARSAPGWRLVELDVRQRTVRVPAGTLLDLGATAKALAADRAAARIAAAVGCGVLVNLGGDIAMAGQPPAGGWRIEVTDELPADPADGGPDGTAGRAGPAGLPGRASGPGRRAPGQKVSIDAGGLATSCTATRSWRRGEALMHHIVVPGTGRPADGCWRTVSVAAASCVDANTASTAAIIRGQDAPGWLDQLGLPARLVRLDGTVVRTGGWPADRLPESVPGWEAPEHTPDHGPERRPDRAKERGADRAPERI